MRTYPTKILQFLLIKNKIQNLKKKNYHKIYNNYFYLFSGDGTFAELFNGLIYRKMMEKSGNSNGSNLDFDNIPYPDIPLGKLK